MPYVGELCGLGTAFLWSLSAVAWSHAGRRVGSQVSSAVRLVLATVAIVALHWAICGAMWPRGGTKQGLVLLSLSGAIGLGLGDLCFFYALKLVGPRIGMLLGTISPGITAILAYFLPPHESLSWAAVAGMVMTMAGVVWVILEEPGQKAWEVPPGMLRRGILMGFLGAALFSVGYLFSRQALDPKSGTGWESLPATFIRIVAAMAITFAAVAYSGNLRAVRKTFSDWITLKILIAGTLVGPVFGIWLSMLSFQHADAGVATALINTGPLFMIPIARFSHGERPTWRGAAGAGIAIAGVALLVLRGKFA